MRAFPLLLSLALATGAASAAPAQEPDGGGYGGGGYGGRHMHSGPGRMRGEAMPDPVVVHGPPAPAEFAQVVGLPEGQVSGYAELYQRFMDQTRPQRDSVDAIRRGMRDAFDAGDRDAAMRQRDQFRPLVDELTQRQSAFDDTLKGMLDKDRWKKYQHWRDDERKRLHDEWGGGRRRPAEGSAPSDSD